MTTSLGKLQSTVIKQEQQIIELKDKLNKTNEENKLLKLKLKKLEKDFDKIVEEKVNNAVNKAVAVVTEKYEQIIAEKDKRIFELECRLNINSSNSSLPSSKDPIYKSKICNSREKRGDKPGRKAGHKKDSLSRFNDEEVTETVEHTIDTCEKCGGHNLDVENVKIRDEIDYEIKLIKRRHRYYEYKCNECGKLVKSKIPLELHSENQYGSGVKTLALSLTNYGFVSYNRTRKIICGLTQGEIDPSEGYLTKLQKKTSDKLSDFVFDIKEKILNSKLNYWDDTVVKIGEKDKACMRVYTNGKYVLYKAHISKDTAGMDEDGILQNLPSDCTVMHDHLLHNYCDEYSYQNIECNAHISRKLKGITENTKHKWSEEMKQLLENMLSKRDENLKLKITKFNDSEIEEFDKQYDEIINKGLKESVELKHKYEFEKEENLLEFMRDYKKEITAWIRDYNLPYSNNICEQLLRYLKSRMKISYQFKDLKHAEYFANIMTYAQTCEKFGINKVTAFKRLFENNPYTISELDKIIEKDDQTSQN